MPRCWKPLLLSLVILTPLGFYTKFYRGPAAFWVNTSLGGLLYEIFWCLLAALVLPSVRSRTIALWVLAITCMLEFLQLWHPPPLEAVRATFLGRAVLGTTFDWSDFPYYFAGSALGWLWLSLTRRSPERPADRVQPGHSAGS
ncbi:MAG TPA: DUF2809 domain-containing protein [Bryobacteraceae bacterium]|nr:DUF2809 domain-containing protein [Bryobacteraceae bacterium]